ncbi:MAG: HAD family phosphatase [Clostridia bacterium]|nr:HAD family phosphatase [Clostridia bacterium]
MSIKGAIFDMDGTLIDSMHLWINIGTRYLNKRGIEVSPEQTKDMSQMLLEAMSVYMQENFGLTESCQEIIDDINAMVENGYYEEVQLKDTVVETLEAFKEAGVKMCVATATDRHLVEACLGRLGILDYFSAVFTCGEEHTTKRIPDIYLKAGAHLGTDPENTFIFEDTLVSIYGAKQSGYKVVGVADKWSAKHEEDVRKNVDFFAEEISDSIPYVL